MLRPVLTAVAVLVASSVGPAADTKPTPAELTDIKQLSEDIFGLPKRKQACEKLGDYGPKAWSAIPNLTELLTEGKEKDAGVLAAAATALGKIGGTAVAKMLTKLAADHDFPEVRAAALNELARIAPAAVKAIEAQLYWGGYLHADASTVVELRLRSILDLLPVKRALTDKVREALKKSDLATAFKVDVLRDVTDAAFVFSGGKTGTVILAGRFDDAPKGKVIELNGFGATGLGLCVSNSVLLLSNDHKHLESLTAPDRKLPVIPNWVAKQGPVRGEKPILWAAADGEITRALRFWYGKGEANDPFGVSAQIDAGPDVWTVTVRIACANDNDVKEWVDRLDKLRSLAMAFLPLAAGNNPGLQEPINDVVKALGKAKVVSNGKVVSLALGVGAATIGAFGKALAGDDK